MEPINSKSEERAVRDEPETEEMSVNDLDKVAGGTTNDPCEGGEFRSR